MRTIELPVTNEWTPELLEGLPPDYRYKVSEGKLVVAAAATRPWHADAVAHQHRLIREVGADPQYAQSRGVLLGALEAESV